MTEKLQTFFAARKTQQIAACLGLISLFLSILCLLVPLTWREHAVKNLGETSLDRLSPLALSLAHYEPNRLRYLIATETTGPTYENLVELLSRAKKDLEFDRLYLIYKNKSNDLRILADADYTENSKDAAVRPNAKFIDGYYDKSCQKQVLSIFDHPNNAGYLNEIYDGNHVLSFVPVKDADSNQVIAVLGADSVLKYANFSQIGGIELSRVVEILVVIFMVCMLCLFIGRSVSGEREPKNGKNDKNTKRWLQKPTVTQQENNVSIDPLDDVDPSDYL